MCQLLQSMAMTESFSLKHPLQVSPGVLPHASFEGVVWKGAAIQNGHTDTL